MSKWATCICGPHGTITIQGIGEKSRMYRAGDRIDLEEVIRPDGQTMGEAVGKYIVLFRLDGDEPTVVVVDEESFAATHVEE